MEESLDLFQKIGDKQGLANASYRFSSFLLDQGDLTGAITLMQQSLELAQEINNKVSIILALCQLGYQVGAQGDRARSIARFKSIQGARPPAMLSNTSWREIVMSLFPSWAITLTACERRTRSFEEEFAQ
jgi:hypothetical protein